MHVDSPVTRVPGTDILAPCTVGCGVLMATEDAEIVVFLFELLGAPESFCSYSFWKKHAATFTLHMHSNDLFPATCGMKWPKCLLDPLADLIGLLNSTSTREKISFSVASETASIDEQSWSSMGS